MNLKLLFFTVLCGPFITVSRAQVPYGDNAAAGNYIRLNGVKHYYEAYGAGPPLLLIHGNSTATKGFAAQIEYFSKKYRVYSVDCRGRGKSELGTDSLSYDQMAKDLSEFIRQLKLDSVCIIGKSDGAIVGLLMAIHFPQHLKKLVAFAANLWPDSTALYAATVREAHEERLKAEQMLRMKDSSKNWLVEKLRYRMLEFQPHITAGDLKKISIPVLVLSADRDVIREEHTLFIYKSIPRANVCILPGETHGLPRNNAQLFNTVIDTYLARPYRPDSYRYEK